MSVVWSLVGNRKEHSMPRRAGKDNNLAVLNPDLAAEWHAHKNHPLTPTDVTPFSHMKVWWLCKKNKKHEWDATIASRSRGTGCTYCAGKRVGKDNNLAVINPDLAAEWHPTKNHPLTPNDVVLRSNKKVWWQCQEGHEWEAIIASRSRGTGCPYCSGNKVGEDNNLAHLNPDLAAEWHPTKNHPLTPSDVVPGSGIRVWWQCQEGHEWEAIVASRSKGHGCPYCSGRYASEGNNLAGLNPKLAAQWHTDMNHPLTPNDVTPGSQKKTWWQCKNEHEWQATIKSRNNGHGCPFCSGRKPLRKI